MSQLLDKKPHKWWQEKAKKWTAGSSIDEAVKCVKKYNQKDYKTIINSIADVAQNPDDIEIMKNKYIDLINAIAKHQLNAGITVRLSNLGMKFSKKKTQSALEEVLTAAQKTQVEIEIDMEERPFVEDAIKMALDFSTAGYQFRLCLQSGIEDIIDKANKLIKKSKNKITFRVVTGSCYPETLEVDEPSTIKQFYQLIDICDQKSAVGTHITERILCAKASGLETQVLMGFEDQQPKGSIDTIYACFGDWKTNAGIRGYIQRREQSV